jgi:hypothetical protein
MFVFFLGAGEWFGSRQLDSLRSSQILATCGLHRARIGEALGIEEAEFRAWTCRLVATREPVE